MVALGNFQCNGNSAQHDSRILYDSFTDIGSLTYARSGTYKILQSYAYPGFTWTQSYIRSRFALAETQASRVDYLVFLLQEEIYLPSRTPETTASTANGLSYVLEGVTIPAMPGAGESAYLLALLTAWKALCTRLGKKAALCGAPAVCSDDAIWPYMYGSSGCTYIATHFDMIYVYHYPTSLALAQGGACTQANGNPGVCDAESYISYWRGLGFTGIINYILDTKFTGTGSSDINVIRADYRRAVDAGADVVSAYPYINQASADTGATARLLSLYVEYPGSGVSLQLPVSAAVDGCVAWLGDARPSKFGAVGITELTEDLNAALRLSPTGSLSAIVLVGDFDTQKQTEQAIAASNCKNIPIVWVVGNHEIDSSGIAGIRDRYALLPSSLNRQPGPTGTDKTTYSIEVGSMHIANINSYWDGGTNDGSLSIGSGGGFINSKLQTWINSNLAATTKTWKIATTHEPLYPYGGPNGRHVGDSLDANKANRDTLQASFVAHDVKIVFCAHTHYSSIHQIGGIYHVDCGVSGHKTADGEDSKASIFYTYTSGTNLILKWIQEPWSSPITKATYTMAGTGTGALPDMTPSQLAAYNGKNGASTYVAVSGIVYNISSSASWISGNHKNTHVAGQDLTSAFLGKHATSYITSFPKVANLVAEPSPTTIEKWVCSGSPTWISSRNDNATGTAGVDYFLSETLCKAVCKATPVPPLPGPVDPGTGWDMGIAQAAGLWLKLNMGGLVPVKKMFINNSKSYPEKYPRNFAITASADNTNWDEILSMSGNESADLIVDFPGNLYKWIKIALTGADPSGNSWAIGELSVYTERPILAKWTDEPSVSEHGLYEAVVKDPKITSKSQAFARAVGEVEMHKTPPIKFPSLPIKYYFDCDTNESLSLAVPGTSINQKFTIDKISYSEGAKGTYQEVIEVRS